LPPTILRPSALEKDDEVLAPAAEKGSASASDVSSRKAKSRLKSATLEPEVQLKKRSAQVEQTKRGNHKRVLSSTSDPQESKY